MWRRVDAAINGVRAPLSEADFATINRFHRRFVTGGLPLKQTIGRAPQSYYLTSRSPLKRIARGCWSFSPRRTISSLSAIPNAAIWSFPSSAIRGPSALVEIGRLMASRGDKLSAFYASNVEFYLFADRKFARFIENMQRLHSTTAIIRSVFGSLGRTTPGYYSSSAVQRVDQLLSYASGASTYPNLLSEGRCPPPHSTSRPRLIFRSRQRVNQARGGRATHDFGRHGGDHSTRPTRR